MKKDKKWTMKEIADLKGCSKQSVQQMAVRHKIRGKRLGPMRYFTDKEAQVLIACVAIKGQKTGGRKVVAAIVIFLALMCQGCSDVAYPASVPAELSFDQLVWKIVMAESSGNERAVGDEGKARGLMQIQEATWKSLTDEPWDRAFDGATNLQVGGKYVAMLEEKYGTTDPAYIAYRWNCGEHTKLSFDRWKQVQKNKIYRSLYASN